MSDCRYAEPYPGSPIDSCLKDGMKCHRWETINPKPCKEFQPIEKEEGEDDTAVH